MKRHLQTAPLELLTTNERRSFIEFIQAYAAADAAVRVDVVTALRAVVGLMKKKAIKEKEKERTKEKEKETSSTDLRTSQVLKQTSEKATEKERCARIIALWNATITPPIPSVREATALRIAKVAARMKHVSDFATWQGVFAWVNRQDWCRAPARRNPDYNGKHGNWVITFDWLIDSDTRFLRFVERVEADAASGSSVAPTRAATRAATRERNLELLADRVPQLPQEDE